MRLATAICVLACGAVAFTARADNDLSESGDCSYDAPACDSCGGCDCLDECCDSGVCGKRLLGLLLPSDHCFDSFISPVSNPFFFEDPRSLTEARGIFIDNKSAGHDRPGRRCPGMGRDSSAVVFRDRLSVIAPRLAYWQIRSGRPSRTYWIHVRAGGRQSTLCPRRGATTAHLGRHHLFHSRLVSVVFQLRRRRLSLLSHRRQADLRSGPLAERHGFRIPLDNSWGTQLWYWSNQWDYELPGHIYPLVGVNWYHWMRSSNSGLTGPITGLDLVNLPAAGVAG